MKKSDSSASAPITQKQRLQDLEDQEADRLDLHFCYGEEPRTIGVTRALLKLLDRMPTATLAQRLLQLAREVQRAPDDGTDK